MFVGSKSPCGMVPDIEGRLRMSCVKPVKNNNWGETINNIVVPGMCKNVQTCEGGGTKTCKNVFRRQKCKQTYLFIEI